MKDRFGFLFWLGWILRFAGGLVLAAAFWTWALTRLFGRIAGQELVLTWCLAVFGSWFVLLAPFMRKKEQIWKRLNQDQEKAADAWLRGMGIFITLLVASAAGWSLYFRRTIEEAGFQSVWLKAVLGTWLALTMPFLIWMYRRSDQIFREAVDRQMKTGPAFRTRFIEKAKRLLPQTVQAQLKTIEPLMPNGHVVTLTLQNGRRVPHVFVLNGAEILGIYDRSEFEFEAAEVTAAEAAEALPAFEESRWLRLDARI